MAAKGKAPRITARRNIAELEAELERRTAERDEALAQQAAAAEVLQIVALSPERLEPVFEAILRNAVRICGGTFGVLAIREGDGFRGAAAHGVGPEFTETLTRFYHPVPGTTLDTVQETKRTIQIADCAAEAAYEPVRARNPAHAMVRTHLCAPMLRDSQLLGAILVYRDEVLPFTDRQVALIEDFAKQAVIAMENVRLIAETREALEQQTAIADVLQVINSSPGDLAPVFDAMLEKVTRLCGASFGLMNTYDGERFRAGAAHRVPAALVEWSERNPVQFGPGTGPAQIVGGENQVHTVDLTATEAYQRGDPSRRALVDLGGARSHLIAALCKDGALLGTIAVYRQEVQPFSDKQIALLQNFAAQAVIAIENARLITELQQRTGDLQESLEYQTATSDVLKVISRSGAELESVLQSLVETAARLCDAENAIIFRLQDNRFRVAAWFGFNDPEMRNFVVRNPFALDRSTLAGRAALDRRIVHVEDVEKDPEYSIELRRRGQYRAALAVPLLREDTLLGAIGLTRSRIEPFTEKQIALVTTFADQAVIAIENARLLGELRERNDEIAGWNRELEARVAEQVEELGRVGRLKRFLAPQLAELIVSQGEEKILESHRREIVVVFCDLRGYTAFTETAEPEEVLDFLREYHGALGPLVSQYEGTLDQFSGDGIMVFFNDPVPIPDPAARAVNMAVAMREEAGKLISTWRERGRDLGFGAGIAQGYATLGQIGFSDRSGYTAIGTVCNLAARLCDEAKDGQILVSGRVAAAVGAVAKLEDLGTLELKGLSRPVAAFNIARSSSAAEARPNLTVVGSGPAP